MARGHTDWLRRPVYGQGQRKGIMGTAVKDDTTTIYTINGRGVALGGWIRAYGFETHHHLKYSFYTDAALFVEATALTLYNRYFYHPESHPIFLTLYNDVDYEHVIGIQKEIAFETSFRLDVTNVDEQDHSIYYRLYYAIVP